MLLNLQPTSPAICPLAFFIFLSSLVHASSNSKVPNSFSLIAMNNSGETPSAAGRALGVAGGWLLQSYGTGMDGRPDSLPPSSLQVSTDPLSWAPLMRIPWWLH